MTDAIFTGTRFEGAGRAKLEPLGVAPGHPAALTRAQARGLICRALKAGVSQHSGQGATLWVLVEFARHHALRHTISEHWGGMARLGYSVTLPDHGPD